MEESKLKEKYMHLQMLDQQIKSAQQQVQALEQQISELKNILTALDEFKNLKINDAILVPLATGIYFNAKIQNIEELMVNVGANVTVKKDNESTKKLVEQQIVEITQVQHQMIADAQEMVSQAKDIQSMLKDEIDENK